MMPLELTPVTTEQLQDQLFEEYNVEVYMVRFDRIHPIVSGNKLYKLKYFLEEAVEGNKQIVTYGGAFSNHLLATAFASNKLQLRATGFVNGERPSILSPTLRDCLEYGMELIYLPRDVYRKVKYGTCIYDNNTVVIPEGGYHPVGAKGALLMWEELNCINPTHTIIPAGTGTTLAGILLSATSEVIAIPAIKGMKDIIQRMEYLGIPHYSERLTVWNEFTFGGFAKTTTELFAFMDKFKEMHHIELDKIYTGKMMYGVMQKIKDGYFPANSKIACLHTGGLQGNRSLNYQEAVSL